jgi:two-component system, chemotaxis family, protein-glutamate methylesterase/glutaminase
MAKIRVLIVEDSLTVRQRLIDVLEAQPDVEVAGVAEDGRTAIELCRTLRPDVVTLDMILPIMSGLAVTEYVMAHFPTPILVVSASTNRGELYKTYEALSAGAVDVLDKPTGSEPDGQWEDRFVATVRLVSKIRVITHLRARMPSYGRELARPSLAVSGTPSRIAMIAIGASTGGPGALLEVLRALPAAPAVPIAVVLHIGEPFGKAFAEWLDGQTSVRVSVARDGEPISGLAGRVVVAEPDRHLVVEGARLRLTSDPERHSCRPSVDVLFESLGRVMGGETAGCLLTGMGRDGAAGLLAIRRAGGVTIAQDEATSVVYGMPREAAMLGAAQRILPLPEIGPAIAELARGVRP